MPFIVSLSSSSVTGNESNVSAAVAHMCTANTFEVYVANDDTINSVLLFDRIDGLLTASEWLDGFFKRGKCKYGFS